MEEKVVALIPAFNEEKTISETINSLKSTGRFSEIFVSNDGSSDQTAQKALQVGAQVIEFERLGKGEAINRALSEIEDYDVLVIADADLGETAVHLQELIKPLIDRSAEMAIASFPKASRKGGFGLVKGLASFLINRESKTRFVSPLSGQRAFRRELLEKILPFEKGYAAEVGSTLKALRLGAKIAEIPLPLAHRETGRNVSAFVHRGKQFFDLLSLALKWR